MSQKEPLAALSAAYTRWHETKGLDLAAWLPLLDDHIEITSIGHEAPGMAFAAPRRSREEAAAYLSAITKEWNMVHWTPETYVCEGDRVAMFGRCGWTHKATGKAAEVRIAHLWEFKNGKAVRYLEIFDSARAAAAALA